MFVILRCKVTIEFPYRYLSSNARHLETNRFEFLATPCGVTTQGLQNTDYINCCVPFEGSDLHSPAAVQGKSGIVQEHQATGMGAPGKTATPAYVERFSH